MTSESHTPPQALQLGAQDNVAVARQALAAGTALQVGQHQLVLHEPIAAGHKLALVPIAAGTAVLKYGQSIGYASADIAAGEHVHVHNLDMGPDKGDFARDYAFGADVKPAPARRVTPGG